MSYVFPRLLAFQEQGLREAAESCKTEMEDDDSDEAPQLSSCQACSPELQELLHYVLEGSGLLGCTSKEQFAVILDVLNWEQCAPTLGPMCSRQASLIHEASLG